MPCTLKRFLHVAVQTDGTVSACCPESVPIGNLLERPLNELLTTKVRERTGCYGWQRLDIVHSHRPCGAR